MENVNSVQQKGACHKRHTQVISRWIEIKRNQFINTAFLQTRGEENYKINLQTTLAGIKYTIQ